MTAALLVLVTVMAPAASSPCDVASAVGTVAVSPADVPMVVEGRVFRPDGRTPAAGVIVYAYQTGTDGAYDRDANGAPKRQVWMKTDAEGRFVLHTLRPGPYPGHKEPAHIHFEFFGPSVPAQWSQAMIFSDDPLTSEAHQRRSAALGKFGFVTTPWKVGGVWRVRVAFRLKPRRDRFEKQIRYGLEACGIDWRDP